MKCYLTSNDPLFDPVTLRSCVAAGGDPRSQQAIALARNQVLGAENSSWQESFRLIQKSANLSAILKTHRGFCRKSMGDPKGIGRDSTDRLRRNLYSLWANDARSLQARDRKGLLL
jgi:hypothetical protein